MSFENLLLKKGDGLITNHKAVGLGILTADCLPLILYDKKKNIIAAIHAGWRGTVQKIIEKNLTKLRITFSSDMSDVYAYFGPCAKFCCYEIQEDFFSYLSEKEKKCYIAKRDKRFFFDNVLWNKDTLLSFGVLKKNIDTTNNHCTICDHRFHSFRRDGGHSGRQATIVFLK